MKILEVKSLKIPEVKVITFGRFPDNRGYFTETFRKSDFENLKIREFTKGINFLQCNESFSRKDTFRGFHFQWNPYMGKLVRPVAGHLIDFALDIRKGSETFGKIIAYDLPVNREMESNEWIWLPPGFAHGVLFPEDSLIEYFCSAEYSPGNEAGISPFANDIDWSLCEPHLKEQFDQIISNTKLIADKDRNAFSLGTWEEDSRSENFTIENCV